MWPTIYSLPHYFVGFFMLVLERVDSPSILGRAPLPISSTTSGFTSVDKLVDSSDFVSLVAGGSPNNPKINLGIEKHL